MQVENRNDSVISKIQPSSSLHPPLWLVIPFSFKNCEPLCRFRDGGLDRPDFRFPVGKSLFFSKLDSFSP